MTKDDLQNEFRVGCWDARYDDDGFHLQHDGMEEEATIDYEDLYDLMKMCSLLDLRELTENSKLSYREQFDRMVRDLEA